MVTQLLKSLTLEERVRENNFMCVFSSQTCWPHYRSTPVLCLQIRLKKMMCLWMTNLCTFTLLWAHSFQRSSGFDLKKNLKKNIHQQNQVPDVYVPSNAVLQNRRNQPMEVPVVNSPKDKLHHQPQNIRGEQEGTILLLYQWFTHIKDAELFVQPQVPTHH